MTREAPPQVIPWKDIRSVVLMGTPPTSCVWKGPVDGYAICKDFDSFLDFSPGEHDRTNISHEFPWPVKPVGVTVVEHCRRRLRLPVFVRTEVKA